MIVRPATPADRSAVEAVVAEAFDEEIVGHVQLSRSWVDARPALVDVSVPSPLSVRPDRQSCWMVGQLVYPEALWATDTVGLRDPLLQRIEDAFRGASAQ